LSVTETIECVDTDVTDEYPDGKNPYIKGIVTKGNITKEDYCHEGHDNLVYEAICTVFGNPAHIQHVCEEGEVCENGICVVDNENQLIAHWSFNSDSNDESGNNNNGVLQGGALIDGRVLNLDGVDDYMSVASSNLININNYDEASFSFWINPNGWGANDRSDLYRDSLSKTGFSLFGAL